MGRIGRVFTEGVPDKENTQTKAERHNHVISTHLSEEAGTPVINSNCLFLRINLIRIILVFYVCNNPSVALNALITSPNSLVSDPLLFFQSYI